MFVLAPYLLIMLLFFIFDTWLREDNNCMLAVLLLVTHCVADMAQHMEYSTIHHCSSPMTSSLCHGWTMTTNSTHSFQLYTKQYQQTVLTHFNDTPNAKQYQINIKWHCLAMGIKINHVSSKNQSCCIKQFHLVSVSPMNIPHWGCWGAQYAGVPGTFPRTSNMRKHADAEMNCLYGVYCCNDPGTCHALDLSSDLDKRITSPALDLTYLGQDTLYTKRNMTMCMSVLVQMIRVESIFEGLWGSNPWKCYFAKKVLVT